MKTSLLLASFLITLSSQAQAMSFWCTTESNPESKVLTTYVAVETGNEAASFEAQVYDSKSYLSETRIGPKAEIDLTKDGQAVGHLGSVFRNGRVLSQYVGWDQLVGTLNGKSIHCRMIIPGPSRRTCPRC